MKIHHFSAFCSFFKNKTGEKYRIVIATISTPGG
jgi:hypothetical protein